MSDDDKILAQPNPGPPSEELNLQLIGPGNVDAYGTRYIPWMDGWAVGFKVIPPDGPVQWLYLNPSSTDEGSERPCSTVFLYHDEDATGEAPHWMGAMLHVETYEAPFQEPTYDHGVRLPD